jgi:hypothetical protein
MGARVTIYVVNDGDNIHDLVMACALPEVWVRVGRNNNSYSMSTPVYLMHPTGRTHIVEALEDYGYFKGMTNQQIAQTLNSIQEF